MCCRRINLRRTLDAIPALPDRMVAGTDEAVLSSSARPRSASAAEPPNTAVAKPVLGLRTRGMVVAFRVDDDALVADGERAPVPFGVPVGAIGLTRTRAGRAAGAAAPAYRYSLSKVW